LPGTERGALHNHLKAQPQGENMMRYDREELKRRLLSGDSLEVTTSGGEYEVWVEPYANPPVAYYEGRVFPSSALDWIIDSLLANLERQAVRCHWVERRGVQVKSCETAYRARAAE
jgi:hypothetical protein